jgi:hypothetical protein
MHVGCISCKLTCVPRQVLPDGVTLELAEIADLPLINTDLEEDVGGGETR